MSGKSAQQFDQRGGTKAEILEYLGVEQIDVENRRRPQALPEKMGLARPPSAEEKKLDLPGRRIILLNMLYK